MARARAMGNILLSALSLAATTRAYISIPYNTSHYFGPDGPWQAASFGLKYSNDVNFATVNLYPSNLNTPLGSVYVPSTQACANYDDANCAIGGSVAPYSYPNATSWYTYLNSDTGYYLYYNGSSALMDVSLPGAITVNGVTGDVCRIAEITYPNGNTVPVEVGMVGLGGSPLDDSYNLPLTLYQDSIIQSNTFGLHIGAAGLNYPGSLIFGGYDRGRVIGPVLSYDAHSALGLLDIVIGVETGASPFSFSSKSGLLVTPNSGSTAPSSETYLKPEYPYIFLPPLTLQAITGQLPVNLDSASGYYLWDTSNPLYHKLISSPAYLGFVFPSLTGETANTTIKVPFALLNLTLDSPVVPSPVPYLPLMQQNDDQNTGLPLIILGRAFMQTAFWGTNWGTNISWLAQAPGPGAASVGLGVDPVDLSSGDRDLGDVRMESNLFNESWAGHWTVLAEDDPVVGGGGGGGGGLSGGAIGGIVVAAVAVIAAIAVATWLILRRKKKREREAAQRGSAPQGGFQDDKSPHLQQQQYQYGGAGVGGLPPHSPVVEMDGSQRGNVNYKPPEQPQQQQQQFYEADGRGHYAELPGGQQRDVAELPGGGRFS